MRTTPFPWATFLNSGFKIHKKTQTMRLFKQLRLWNRSKEAGFGSMLFLSNTVLKVVVCILNRGFKI